MEIITDFLTSGVFPVVMLVIRAIVPVTALYVVWRSYTSFRKGQRKRDPVVMLWDEKSDIRFPVLFWENSIGRSKSCDIYLPDPSASRDHAVLMRREEGWFICDTGSKSGVLVNGKRIEDRKLVNIGDRITIGSTTMSLWNSDAQPQKKRKIFTGFSQEAASPAKLMVVTTVTLLLMALQSCVSSVGTAEPKFDLKQLIPCGIVLFCGWAMYVFSVKMRRHVSFEVETVGVLLSGIGINLLAAYDFDGVKTQMIAMLLGMLFFMLLIWFIGDMERVAKVRLYIGIAAILLLALTLVIGKSIGGAKNWIIIGPLSIQPSELVKVAFVFVGASTLDRLQTKKNITEFLIFTGACGGCIALMNDFGSALVFFAGFLIIAFMRSGSVRTIALVLVGAALGVMLIITLKPHVMNRFSLWGHIWDDIYGGGYQQTHMLTYIASGGLFGVGLGKGCMPSIAMADSDLVFGLLCEEQGLVLAFVVLGALGLFIMYARSDVTRSRSTFFSIAACAAAGMLIFQACLNVFGSTDILPFTGVTLPFISSGGTSIISAWGLLAFIKASDERTYAARRTSKDDIRRGGKKPAERPDMVDIHS